MPSKSYFFPTDGMSHFKILFWMIFGILVMVTVFGVLGVVFFAIGNWEWTETIPGGVCPPACISDSDVKFVLTPKAGVTVSYVCINGFPQAEIIPAPDVATNMTFSTPDKFVMREICRKSVDSIPSSATITPYLISTLVYGKCGITYRCALQNYNL